MIIKQLRNLISLCLLALLPTIASADDWPMWRHNPGRTAQTDQSLPAELHLQWQRSLSPLKPAYRNSRLQFDAGYEPIVKGQTLYVASSANDSVTAYDVHDGSQKWRFYTDGPIRFAPVAWKDKVIFGSDDGHLYCLDAAKGNLVWKFRAVPSNRKVLGNGRLISVWPVRGGPVVSSDVVYFAAGVWPFEGVFVYAVDARTGKLRWLNDRTGYIYGQHPHATEAFGGITPQGYLVVSGDELIVPCGSALPARFDLKTGKLNSFSLPKAGRSPGGWFAAQSRATRRGEAGPSEPDVVVDASINADRHEDREIQGPGSPAVRSTVRFGKQTVSFDDDFQGIKDVHSIVLADAHVFVTAGDGTLSCFGSKKVTPKTYTETEKTPLSISPAARDRAKQILQQTKVRSGYCLVWGVGDGQLLKALTEQSELYVIGIDPDPAKIELLRSELDTAGRYGERINLLVGTPQEVGIPPYMANLVVCADAAAEGKNEKKYLTSLFRCLRPFGGTAWIARPKAQADLFHKSFVLAQLSGGELAQTDVASLVKRSGPLVGSTNYAGGWSSPDKLVAAPLGVLWYDDVVGNFKRAPQPNFVDGVMISHNKNWVRTRKTDPRPYSLKPAIYSDVYTGRVFSEAETATYGNQLPHLDITQKQPSQYRPPQQEDDWKPKKPVVGRRINPLTGRSEPRAIVKAYGCDGGNDYGLLFTVRSGTAAFYDKRTESGTIHISGPRSGCTNSIIPANGLLNVPYYFQGCTCSYPLPVGLAMVSLPPEHEQWTVWGRSAATSEIQRVGINLGAPGDRTTKAGTLWIDVPSVGGPSPNVAVEMKPKDATPFYRHSLWIEGGRGWPWVAASGVVGITSLKVSGLARAKYTVRLYFADLQRTGGEKRVFDVTLQNKRVLTAFNVIEEAGGPMRSLVKEFTDVDSKGSIDIELKPRQGRTLLSGVELIAEGLKAGPLVTLKNESKVPGQ